MDIPIKLEEILKCDQEKHGIVLKTISDFEKILKANNMEFFPDYTDHGINHVENVLFSIQSLITEDSFELLNSMDITIIILATVAHDIGMHISHPGFLKLINGHYDIIRINKFDKLDWKSDWNLFINEAKKFNQKQKINLWGDKNVNIIEPPETNLTDNDKRLIGEFIRRHHARLAHEIVLNGFPTANGENIEFAHGLEMNIKDIIGLAARSHGMVIRDTFDYLEFKFNRSKFNPYDSKIIFLMGLIRIADYVQIEKERADSIVLRTKSFSSPIAKQEWEKHDAIKFISVQTDDPELIHIHAEPKTSSIYLELIKLFEDIQKEIDLTWAVIGEVYGRNEVLSKLKYKYRRIFSTIDDKDKFSESSIYIPEKIMFDAEPELLKLLVGPLYGNNPTYGVRELLQNAVDACLERQQIIFKKYGGNSSREYLEYKPEIKIKIECNENNEYFFTIIDNGIGMSKEILINYYFKAGASFINSELWKKDFVEEKESTIRRTGRFGVGVLASFLLGDEIILNTRFLNSTNSYTCSAFIDSEQIEVLKSTLEIGTSIKIKLRESIIKDLKDRSKKLDWFTWYRFKKPNITYDIFEELKERFIFLKDTDFLPVAEINNGKWRTSYPENFKKVNWTLSLEHNWKEVGLIDYFNYSSNNFSYSLSKKQLNLFCNGFCIPNGNKVKNVFGYSNLITSVFDFNSKLPLTLNRNSLEEKSLPFLKTIQEDIAKDFIARLLTLDINKPIYYSPSKILHVDYLAKIDLTGRLIFKENGFLYYCSHILNVLGISLVTHIWLFENRNINPEITSGDNIIFFISKYKSIHDFNRRISSESESYFSDSPMEFIYPDRNEIMKRVILNKKRYDYLFEKDKKRIANYLKNYLYNENKISDKWVTLVNKDMKGGVLPSNLKSNIKYDVLEKFKDNIGLVIECYYNNGHLNGKNELKNLIELYLDIYLGPDYIIPYKIEERQRKYPKAFSDLRRYIEFYTRT